MVRSSSCRTLLLATVVTSGCASSDANTNASESTTDVMASQGVASPELGTADNGAVVNDATSSNAGAVASGGSAAGDISTSDTSTSDTSAATTVDTLAAGGAVTASDMGSDVMVIGDAGGSGGNAVAAADMLATSGGAPAGGATGFGGAGQTGGSSSGGTAAIGGAAAGGAASGGFPAATDPGTEGDGEFTVGPNYTADPDGRKRADAPDGFSFSFTMNSEESAIFSGDDFNPPQPFTRKIEVFVPEQYVDGDESPFMVSSDGFYGGLRAVVQNLADDPDPNHRVPPLVIIGIQNGPNTSGRSERSLEYDTVSDRYWRLITQEIIPAILDNSQLRGRYPNFKLSSDPNARGGYGCSSGGPAVFGLAWFGDFNRVFSFSGSFVNIQKTAEHPDGAWEYPEMILAAPPRPDLRVFLEVGENDNRSTSPESDHNNWVIANRNMAAALEAQGNHYRFIYATGAGHCDNNARNQVMPEGLIWLWRGYTPN